MGFAVDARPGAAGPSTDGIGARPSGWWGMRVGTVPPVTQTVQSDLGLPRVNAGPSASSLYGLGVVFGVACGLRIDRQGAGRTILEGGAVMASASLACGLAASVTLLLATHNVEGFGVATSRSRRPSRSPLRGAQARRSAFGARGTCMPVGLAVSLVIATALPSSVGLRGLRFLNGGLILLRHHRCNVSTATARMRV